MEFLSPHHKYSNFLNIFRNKIFTENAGVGLLSDIRRDGHYILSVRKISTVPGAAFKYASVVGQKTNNGPSEVCNFI